MNYLRSVLLLPLASCAFSADSVEQYLEEGYSFVTVGYWNDAGLSGGVAEALEIAHEASGRSTSSPSGF